MTAAPIRRRCPQVEVWRQGQAHRRRPARRVEQLPPLIPSGAPPIEQQLAALEGELRAWGREGLV